MLYANIANRAFAHCFFISFCEFNLKTKSKKQSYSYMKLYLKACFSCICAEISQHDPGKEIAFREVAQDVCPICTSSIMVWISYSSLEQ